jgi:bifunctional non-homologous end joining protein LigD
MSVKEQPAVRRLAEYQRKRRFDDTPEPPPASANRVQEAFRFVVHEHHARRLHWDLRLEHKGTLASWAIPNGIPQEPTHNRKAIHVEDHPLSYIDFHGTIPDGNYGAGKVSVWDHGTYRCEKWEPAEIIVEFTGERLRGRYALFRTGGSEKDWMIHRMDPPADPATQTMPQFVEPMLAKLSSLPSDEGEWAFEVKWDGVRAIARSEPGRLRVLSRNGNDVTSAYPELRAMNRALSSHDAILDGEIVAFDEHGRPSFDVLQTRMHQRTKATIDRLATSTPVTYVIFDLLWLDGHNLMSLPYTERREKLERLQLEREGWLVPEFHLGAGTGLLAATKEQGLEGIVAKRLDSPYTPGARNGSWLKIKNVQRQEVVVGGWTDGKGSRVAGIGALHIGVYDKGAFRYVGRVGTGFNQQELERLGELFAPLKRKTSPFEGSQPSKGAHFVQPELVCEVEFTEWTREGLLRHPSYKGLREDKPAGAIVRERVQPPPHAELIGQRDTLDLDELIPQGRPVRGGLEVEVEGRLLKLTNLGKVLYPRNGFTKGQLIGYYASIAPVLLAHLRGRPLTLKRYPNGVASSFFYEKDCPRHAPEWVKTAAIWSEHSQREIHYCLCEDLPTLVWVANLASIELHPSLSDAQHIQHPTTLAFDLDPGAPASIVQCCEVAIELHDMFSDLDMRSFVKTSGSKGLQVYIPINAEELTYEQTKPFAHAVAALLEQRRSELVVSTMARSQREGKVLIDWSQNDEHKTTVSAYSLRARGMPTVSTPVTWEEIQACLDTQDPEPLGFEAQEVLDRVRRHGDLFAEVLSLPQPLPDLRG